MKRRFAPSFDNPWFVTALFAVLAIGMTWPLLTGITTEIAGDLGDPVLNCWIMMWTAGRVLRFLKGDWSALGDYWNGNIFYPERLTLAYSEHLTPQMLQILPVYAVTGNIVLSYNLLVLSTIALSGLGMYLLVRELTGRPLAAVIAGAAFAFSPYRAYQIAHLQVISTQWMPLALYGFHRYFVTGRVRALVGGALSLALQTLSCGYYLFYFVPFAAAFCVYDAIVQRVWRERKVWMHLAVAGAGTLLLITPFLLPYLRVRQVADMGVRSIEEVIGFSADTWAYATAFERLTFWGPKLQTFVQGEGKTFPGLTILLLAAAGMVAIALRSAARRPMDARPRQSWRTAAAAFLSVAGVVLASSWIFLLTTGGGEWTLGPLRVSVRDVGPLELQTAVCLLAAIALFPAVRRFLAGSPKSVGGFLVLACVASVWLSLGPEIHVHGKSVGTGPYWLLYKLIPGFDGTRTPARFFMVTTMFLAALAGVAIAAIIDRSRRAGAVVAAASLVLILGEGLAYPFPSNVRLWVEHFELAPRHLASASTLGPVYDKIRDLPSDVVVAEFPFGSPPFDVQTVFYSGFHGKPVINGYSGFYPSSFKKRMDKLAWDPSEDAPGAWRELMAAGVSHVVVHEAAYFDEKGAGISAWLRAAGAREIATDNADHLFALK